MRFFTREVTSRRNSKSFCFRLRARLACLSVNGIPPAWGAGEHRSGVAAVSDFSKRTVSSVVERIAAAKRPGDIAVVSIHWGSNWGYGVPKEHRAFAHQLLDGGVADVVHGHC